MNKNTLTKIIKTMSILGFMIPLLSCQSEQETTSLSIKGKQVAVKNNIAVNDSRKQLIAEFLNPPAQSKPLTWFHAMSGNMSAAGISKDLEAIADVGLGGTLLFNVTQGIPLGKVKFNSTEHIDLIGHMAKESQRLDLSFGMHNCDGWTSSGGPWITPEHSMKKLTFNETIVKGGEVNIQLAQPFTLHNYYQDVAVLAYPALATELDDAKRKPVITSSDVSFDAAMVTNKNLEDYSTINKPANSNNAQDTWLQLSYQEPYTLRRIDLLMHQGRGLKLTLYISNDGKDFTPVRTLGLRRPSKSTYGFDEAFDGVTAKYFRLVADKSFNVKEVSFTTTPSINNYLARTSASRTDFNQFEPIGNAPQSAIINSKNILDVTASVDNNGRLITRLPAGNWTIMRFGYTTTGAVNIPASREGTGLEVDKFSKVSFKTHYDAYVTNVINKVKQVAPNAMHTLEIDSYEVGAQNWTGGYEQQFKNTFGYDLVTYLPLFAGKFVDSAETTEQVLWDTRELNNQLITQNYYQYFTELAHQDGIKTYLEPYGSGPFNELDVASKADLPMGEFWLDNNHFKISASSSTANIYNKPLVSAEAFTQFPGNNWLFHPAKGKKDGDKSWALGVNQHVFHRFAHQANTHVMPGMTMNRWGAHLDRTQPWWNTAGKAWFKYIARGQHLLRTGYAVSDVLWYLGDASPTVCPENDELSSLLPSSMNYDCLNSEVLSQLKVSNGKLSLPHGSEYKVLVLNNHQTLSFESLKYIYQLAKQGAVIVGEPTTTLAGYNPSAEQQQKFASMVDFIWSQPSTYMPSTDFSNTGVAQSAAKKLSKPSLHTTATHASADKHIDWQKIYQTHGFAQDLTIRNHSQYYFTHRKSADLDIYFIYNDSDQRRLFDANFNVTGKIPELWQASNGEIKKLGAFESDDTHTRVAFRLDPAQSVFVVFAESSTGIHPVSPDVIVKEDVEVVLRADQQLQLLASPTISAQSTSLGELNLALNKDWTVTFNKTFGLGSSYHFDRLIDWRDHTDKQVQNYSGTATYTKNIDLSENDLSDNSKLILDLGQVSIAATVTINGQLVGTSWLAPHTLDISSLVKVGSNQITIEVANLWVNRLLADRKLPDTSGFKIARWQDPITVMPEWFTNNQPPPASERITFSTQLFMDDNEPNQASGLIGPITLKYQSKVLMTVKK